MLKIKTITGQSMIHGRGLFVAENVPAGTVVCEFLDWFDRSLTDQEFASMPETVQRYLEYYGYYDTQWRLNSDDMRFCNHSTIPNLVCDLESNVDIAARDIQAGDELTVDYTTFDKLAKQKLGIE